MAVTSCDDDDDPKVPELKFDPAIVEIAPEETATITVSEGAAPFTVVSSDEETATATVEENIITVAGIKEGTATITVTDENKKTGTVSVTVKEEAVEE